MIVTSLILQLHLQFELPLIVLTAFRAASLDLGRSTFLVPGIEGHSAITDAPRLLRYPFNLMELPSSLVLRRFLDFG